MLVPAGRGGDDGVLTGGGERRGLVGDMGDARWIVHVWPGIRLDIFEGGGSGEGLDHREPLPRPDLLGAGAPRVDVVAVGLPHPVSFEHVGRFQIEDAAHVAVQPAHGVFIHSGRPEKTV